MKITENDTIAAIATAASDAGIGIIRISGPEVFQIVSGIFLNGKKEPVQVVNYAANTIHFGYIADNDEIIDEVLLSVMKAPHSYTTDDTAEINTHGGTFVMSRVLSLVLSRGARLAEPGEFTKRAFLGGRIDLARAEAVMDLISSQSEFARKTAVAQLSGSISNRVREIRGQLIYELAFIESALDDPENYSLEDYPERLEAVCSEIQHKLQKLLLNAEEGRILKSGVRTVIVGRPNVGKSSLLNALLGEERAIVTQIPGTTRDTLEENARIDGVLLKITDTAGIRESEDVVEQIGIRRALETLSSSDLILFVLDASQPLKDEDHLIADHIAKLKADHSPAHCIVLLNKGDLPAIITEADALQLFEKSEYDSAISIESENDSEQRKVSRQIGVIKTSMKQEAGLNELGSLIKEWFRVGELTEKQEVFLSNIRHIEAVREANHAISLVRKSIHDGMSEDFFSIDLMNAYESLGRILGESVEDDLVEEIFSKFCLGK